jgi:hypothetical protein
MGTRGEALLKSASITPHVSSHVCVTIKGNKNKLYFMHKRKRTGRKSFSGVPYGKPEYKKARYAMYKSPRIGWPQEYVTTLKYTTAFSFNTVGGSLSSYRFCSDCFDIDPAVGGHAMPGFTQYATLYARHRPLKMAYDLEYANREAFNVVALAGFSNSSAAVVDLENAGQALWKNGIMGPLTGFNKVRLKDSATMVKISGTKQPLYDDLFTGSTTSATISSAGLTSLYLGIQSPNAVFTAGGGVDVRISISMTIQFYKVNTLDV